MDKTFKMYKAIDLFTNARIIPVDAKKATKAFVDCNDPEGLPRVFRQRKRMGSLESYHETWEEARQHLLRSAIRRYEHHKEAAQHAEESVKQLRELKEDA